MLGGMAMLVAAFLFTRHRSDGVGPGGPSAVRFRDVPRRGPGQSDDLAWMASVSPRSKALSRWGGRVVSASRDRCVIAVTRCASCHGGRRPGRGCEVQRRALQTAIRRRSPAARVVEVACGPGRGACTFEVHRR